MEIQDSGERGSFFRRPSASDLEALRCDLSGKFQAVEETRHRMPVNASRPVLQDVARPLASSVIEPPVVSQKDSAPEPCAPYQKDSAPEPCAPYQKDSPAEPCAPCQKDSPAEPCAPYQKDSPAEPCVASQTAVAAMVAEPFEASEKTDSAQKKRLRFSKKSPVEPISDKAPEDKPFPKPSGEDAGEAASDIPEVPESFTRLQQRALRKSKVAAQRKRKHGDEDETGEAEQNAEEAQPCVRGRGGRGCKGRGRGGRGRGHGSRDDENPSRSRSPMVMKRPAAKSDVRPKTAKPSSGSAAVGAPSGDSGVAVKKKKGPKSAKPSSGSNAAVLAPGDDSGEAGEAMKKLKLIMDGLPLLKVNTADKMKTHPDYHSRDMLPIPVERREDLKAIVGSTQVCNNKHA